MAEKYQRSRQVRRPEHTYEEPTTDIPYNESHRRAATVVLAAEATVEHIDTVFATEFPEN